VSRTLSRRAVVAVIAVLLAAVLAVRVLDSDDSYKLRLLMTAADGVKVGTPVRIAGREVGQVTDLSVQGNAAQVTVSVDEGSSPLHAGTDARIAWNSVIGRRDVELRPGPEKNPELPSGKVVQSSVERVELDDLVAALDAPTRKKVRSLVAELETVVDRNDTSLRETLNSAGPFVEGLGEVLRAVGSDGASIKRLVTDLRQITKVLANRDTELASTVQDLSKLLETAVQQEKDLRTSLDEVNTTVAAGNRLFTRIPGAVDATVPLLEDLRPATDRLPAVSKRLGPVLTDLRPVVGELRPTLTAAQTLLGQTPSLLDNGTPVVSDLDQAVTSAHPAVEFLRPYTPEVVGFLTNWASLFSAKNPAGHFGRAMIPASVSSVNNNPGILPPGMTQWQEPLPGQLAGQPWTDANGDAVR
jgi:phospholipid/cholesterol/gamma-HCH transport system substrate-binding protein